MQRWAGPLDVPDDWGRSVVTIGVFDGVHRGHQLIVTRAMESARDLGLPVVVVTFDPHPDEVVRPGSHPPLLCTARRESELLAGLGVDAVLVIPFTLEFSRLGPDEFVRAVLVDRLHAARVVVGENFRFGHKAAGDVALLAELGEKYDFTAEGVPLLTENGVTISSTGIRAMLTAGDVVGCRARPGQAAPGRGRRRPRASARARPRVPDREPRDASAHRDSGRRGLRGLAGRAGHRRPGAGALAGRDLGRHQPHLRRAGTDCRGVRA